MLTNKYMNANFFLWGFATGSRQVLIGNNSSACGSSQQDAYRYNTVNTDFPDSIEFYTTQPINIDRLTTESAPVAETLDATSMVADTEYTIATVGDTDYTLVGAADNNIGTTFTATGPATGTGTVNTLDNGSRLLLQYNLICEQTTLQNGAQTMPSLYFYTNDDNKNPLVDGTCEWFLLKKGTQVICMGEVSDFAGNGDIKLSSVTMTTADVYRFYSLRFGIDAETAIYSDANTVLVSA